MIPVDLPNGANILPRDFDTDGLLIMTLKLKLN